MVALDLATWYAVYGVILFLALYGLDKIAEYIRWSEKDKPADSSTLRFVARGQLVIGATAFIVGGAMAVLLSI